MILRGDSGSKLSSGPITASGYSGKVYFCYTAGYRNIGSVDGGLSVLLAKFVKLGSPWARPDFLTTSREK